MMVLAIYALLLAEQQAERRAITRALIVAAMACAAAASTKKAGLFFLLGFPILTYGLVLRPRSDVMSFRARMTWLSGLSLVAILLGTPWLTTTAWCCPRKTKPCWC